MYKYQNMISKTANSFISGREGHAASRLGEGLINSLSFGTGDLIHSLRMEAPNFEALHNAMAHDSPDFEQHVAHLRSQGVNVFHDPYETKQHLQSKGYSEHDASEAAAWIHGTSGIGPHYMPHHEDPDIKGLFPKALKDGYIHMGTSRNTDILRHEYGHHMQQHDPSFNMQQPGVFSRILDPHSQFTYKMESDAWDRAGIPNSHLRDGALSTYSYGAHQLQSNAMGAGLNLGMAGAGLYGLHRMMKEEKGLARGSHMLSGLKPEHYVIGAGVGAGATAVGIKAYNNKRGRK